LYKAFILFILPFALFASNVLMLKEDVKTVNASSYIYYIQDKNSEMNASDILNSSTLTLSTKNGHLGNRQGPFWSKLSIQNDSNRSRTLLLQNLLAGTNHISVYIYKKGILKKSILLGDMCEQENRIFLNRYSAFELLLAPYEEIIIISKVSNFSIVNIAWIIEKSTLFMEKESKFLIIFSLIGGIFIFFMIISFIYYLFYKKVTYLIISIFVLNTFLYQFGLQGLLYSLDIGINLEFNTFLAWVGGSLSKNTNYTASCISIFWLELKNSILCFLTV